MLARIHITKYELGLRFVDGDLAGILRPGTHWLWTGFGNQSIERIDRLETRLCHEQLDMLVRDPALSAELIVLDLTDTQRALVWKDQRLLAICGPGLHAFWREPAKIETEIFDINDLRLEHRRLASIVQHADAARLLEVVEVDTHERALLYRNGTLAETLGHGLHAFWRGAGRIQARKVDLREQMADVAGQEIMTADKVTLRINLVVTYRITDPEKCVTAVADASQALYRDAQLALRASVGGRALDALLSDKESVGGEVRQALVGRAAAYGVEVQAVGLRDIILPGDMKLLLNQVIAATKEAEANLIRRREETAAARSQANTAKLLAENPQLARLKELEALQQILAGAKTAFVFGAGDIATQVKSLVTAEKDA